MSSPFTSHLSPLTVHRSPSSFTSHLSPLTSSGPSTSPRTGGKGWSLRLHSPFRLSPLTSHFSPPPAPRLPANRRQRLEPSLTFAVPPLTSHLSLLTSSGPSTSPRTGGKGWSLRLHSPFRLSLLTSHLLRPLTSRLLTPFLSCDFPINAPLGTIGNTVVG